MTSLSAIDVRSSSSEKERWKPVEYNSDKMTWRKAAGETPGQAANVKKSDQV